MSGDNLNETYARILRRRSASDRAECVPVDDLLASLLGTCPELERLRLLDHIMACGDCRAEFELLRAVHTNTP